MKFLITKRQDVRRDDQTCAQRRRLLSLCAGGLLAASMPSVTQASVSLAPRRLSFSHTHTGETLSLTYRVGSVYVPAALSRINTLMRDFRTGDEHPMDPELLDILWTLQEQLDSKGPYHIISAYRSSRTNESLRGRSASTGVAKRSLHLTGQAIDVRLPDVSLSDLRDAAIRLKRGGVGYYPESGFVHIDTGRVRHW